MRTQARFFAALLVCARGAARLPLSVLLFIVELVVVELMVTTFCVLMFCVSIAEAQPVSLKVLRDSKGKEFFLAFPPNEHTGGGNNDKIVLMLSADQPTRGEVVYRTPANVARRMPFIISQSSEVVTLEIPYLDIELSQNEQVSQQSVYVRADEEISLYAANLADRTSDAFLVFPVDVLGTDHIVASYNSDVVTTGGGVSTPSQFVVIATDNETVVDITPSAPTLRLGMATPQQVRLQRGEVYLVQASMPRTVVPGYDLTGSRVRSNKPIVVIGSHQRSLVPASLRLSGGGSRDHLLEQIPPIDTWGTSAFVAPYPAIRTGQPDLNGNFFRVIAAFDSTLVSINGRTAGMLSATSFLESAIGTGASVSANKQILVVGYRRTADGTGNQIGDPFMAIIPPAEQYLKRYRFVSAQGVQRAQVGGANAVIPAFEEHYVNVVIPTRSVGSVVLDGTPVDRREFRALGTTEFSYANLRLNDGTHTIVADTVFGITALGYGIANSYGYTGGQRFETDLQPPRIAIRRDCPALHSPPGLPPAIGMRAPFAGAVYDSAATDSKVFWVSIPDTSLRNVRVQLSAFPRPADSVRFTGTLINPFEDGSFFVDALDSLELRTSQRVLVPGFTVHADARIRTNDVVRYSTTAIALAAGVERCFDLVLTNYGSTTQTIHAADFAASAGEFSARGDFPITIAPRAQARVQMCFRSDRDGVFSDTLRISDGCVVRPIAVMMAESGFDRVPPTVVKQSDSCSRVMTYTFTDRRRYDAGVDRVDVVQSQNVNIQTVRATNGTVQTSVSVVNPRQDVLYTLVVRDSVGNAVTIRDTIKALSIRLLSNQASVANALSTMPNDVPNGTLSGGQQPYTFVAQSAQSLRCDSIQVVNDGTLPFVLDSVFLARNTAFSLPLSQFPIIIPAGATRFLKVCFSPSLVQNYRDTISVSRLCLVESLPLLGSGVLGVSTSESRCTATLSFRSQSVTTSSVSLNVYPEPAVDKVIAHISVPHAEALTVALYTMLGISVMNLPARQFESGEWDVEVNVSSLEAGVYVCEVRSATGARVSKALRVGR